MADMDPQPRAVDEQVDRFVSGGPLQKEGFTGQVLLTVEAADRLRAEMDVATLGGDGLTAEVSPRPEHAISPGHFQVKIVGTQGKQKVKLPLDVEIGNWEVEGISEYAATEKARFTTWLAEQNPSFTGLDSQAWVAFQTYPEMLVVEHWTFLSPEWEMRICVHVMIPPHDWSMVRLRRRGETEPAVTAKRETDGSIHPISPGEYPTFGY